MIFIGIDPPQGFAVVTDERRPRVLGCGILAKPEDAPSRAVGVASDAFGGTIVTGVEVVTRVHPVRRKGRDGSSTVHATYLYQTGRAAGIIFAGMRLHGRVVEVTAEDWRKALTGSPTAGYDAIERALRLRLERLPTRAEMGVTRKDDAVHVYDALGIAGWCAARERLPAALRGGRKIGPT